METCEQIMSRLRNLKRNKPLTREQKVLAAINSDHPSVKNAIEKLAFVTEMSHTKEEMQDLVDPWVRRIKAVFEHEGEYKRYLFRWCGDNFEIENKDGQMVQAGKGTAYGDKDIPEEPVLVYVLDKGEK